MKNKTSLPRCVLLLSVCFTTVALAGQQPCQPPKLPIPLAGQNIFSESQETDLGDAVAQHLQRDHRVIVDDEVTGYVRRIGERIIKHLPPTNLQYQFFLIDLNELNAFTLPGGRIYLSRKLVAFAQNEDELAGVIAHELGHILARHSTIDTTILFREVLGVTEVTDRRDIFEKYNQLIENTARKPKAFEKLDNHEAGNQNVADLIGLYAMVRAGYDPQAQASLWDRYHELKGKTGGGFLSNLFGRTKPEQKRLREMLKGLESLPAECRGVRNTASGGEFRQWQTIVVSYTGNLGRKESVPGLISKQALQPALRSDINQLRFSPDGKFILAQDDSGINVLSREPLAPLFRIDATDAKPAQFTPDSRMIVFSTSNMRVEVWEVAEKEIKAAYELVTRKKCLQIALAPDGKVLACLDSDFGLNLFEVATGTAIFEKKAFTQVGFSDVFMMLLSALLADDDSDRIEHEFINMAFSPDGHYFVAGDRSVFFSSIGTIGTNVQSLAYDLTTKTASGVKGDLKEVISSAFAFVGPDKIVGRHSGNPKKSGLYSFPAGKAIANFDVSSNSLWPVTSGDYVLLRTSGGYSGGLLDLTTQKVLRINQRVVLDAYGSVLASQQRNGELGLYNLKSVTAQTVALPQTPFGRLYAADITPDFKWLAVSGYSKGAVWDLAQKEMVFHVRGFRGAHLGENKMFFADFPKLDPVERNVAHLNLATRDITVGAKLENGSARQHGNFVIQMNTTKKSPSYWENVVMEVRDGRTLSPLWSLSFVNERPRYWAAPREGTLTLLWPVSSKAVAAETKDQPDLKAQLSALKEKKGDYLLKVLDLKDGKALGKLLIETGKGSFRITDVLTSGDWVAISDTQNRTLVYSLSNGQQKGKVFGRLTAISPESNLLCVENGEGLLTLHELASFEKREQFTFPSRVSLVRFSDDGKRLFVLTSDQTVYLLDVSSVALSN
jgi:WD40 repeat protein